MNTVYLYITAVSLMFAAICFEPFARQALARRLAKVYHWLREKENELRKIEGKLNKEEDDEN